MLPATLNISKAANFTIVIDPRNGDVVKLRGEAHLNGGIDASGKNQFDRYLCGGRGLL